MNNFKYSYAKKYHYMLKYFVMALPLLLLFISYLLELTDSSFNLSLINDLLVKLKTFAPWYANILYSLRLFSADLLVDNLFTNVLLYYPLYIVCVYLFDLILDVISIIFKLVHKLLNKVVKDYD